MYDSIVIVGAGQAAVQAIETLRREGYTGRLTVIGEESSLPYQRPPLSKKYLAGMMERERLLLRPAEFYAAHAVEVRLGRRVEEISRRERRLRLDDRSSLPYDALLIATGSRPRPLQAPGAGLEGVHVLRSITDAERVRAEMFPGGRLVVVGGGYIGLEVAATAGELGVKVTVLEMADRVMSRVACPQVSAFYEAEHARRGVRVVCAAKVRELVAKQGTRKVGAVVTEDGERYPADLVIIGIGVSPADELAAAAGLECAHGVRVDERCRTSDPAIYAAGDCTSHPSVHYGRRLRLESVDNAFEQGASAARNLLGHESVHDKVPWFWSDQYDLKLIIVGIAEGADSIIVRGEPALRAFSVCYLRNGELIAIDTINRPQEQLAARKLIAARIRPDLDKLGDPNVPLKNVFQGPASHD